MAGNSTIADMWQEYCDGFVEQSAYFKEPQNYTAVGKGDINTYKLFLERFYSLLSEGGCMGIVVPSGIYTDQGCQPLRQLLCLWSRGNRRWHKPSTKPTRAAGNSQPFS